jgi:hypothetical protein
LGGLSPEVSHPGYLIILSLCFFLEAGGMAAYAILKIRDALVTVLLLDPGRVVLMAIVAGVG